MNSRLHAASDVRACFYAGYWAGSAQVRGVEVASTRSNWTFSRRLTDDQIRAHDVFCVVKKPDRELMASLRALGKTVVYDTVDPWRQPEDGLAFDTLDRVHGYFRSFLASVPADGVIFANRTMCDDLGRYVENATYIYHHFQPALTPIEVRERAEVVGYHGVAAYLGEWREAIERACRANGLTFAAVPAVPFDQAPLRRFDIGVVARGGDHGSLMARRYKSNVKLANFYGAAIPCIVARGECSYRETADEHVGFFGDEADLTRLLGELRSYRRRLEIHQAFLLAREQFSLEAVSGRYEDYFRSLLALRRPRAGTESCSN